MSGQENNEIFIKYSQLGQIFDHLSLGVVILSPDRKIESINRSAELLTGCKASEVAGKYCYHIFLNYLCGGNCKFLETGDPEKENLVSDVQITDHASDRQSITKIESPIYDSHGKIVGCMEIFQDHSAFKELIRRIRYDDLRLKIILDNLDIGVMTADRGNHISFFNTMAETITGFSRSDVLGNLWDDIFGKDFSEEIRQLQQSESAGTRVSGTEARILSQEGRSIPVRVNYMALRNEDGHIVGGLTTLSDISLEYHFKSAIRDRYTCYDMVGKDPVMEKLFEIIPIVAATDAAILIEGPTGTGKDLLAKVIHNAGRRSRKPLVKVNCAALPDNLLESEMFGYVKGAFTGADRNKPGRFQEADGGTIFLDEIGDIPLSLQAKLLRVIEDKEFYALGSRKITKVDVRIISATNRGLEKLVREKRFREDLFYRLNVMRLELPALRKRKSDIPLLISHILKRLCAERDIRVSRISEDAMDILLNHDYPGNIREMENILEHALIISRGTVIEPRHFPVSLSGRSASCGGNETDPYPDDNKPAFEKHRILTSLEKHNWKRGKTANALHIDRTTLWRKMKKYGIQ